MLLRLLTLCLALMLPSLAHAQTLEELVARLPDGNFNDRAEVVNQIAATGDPRALAVLEALLEGDLEERNADGRIVIVTGSRSNQVATDVLTGEDLGAVARRSTTSIRVNNGLRRSIRSAMGVMTLRDPDPARRLAAAEAALRAPDAEQVEALAAAMAAEQVASIRQAQALAHAAAVLASDAETEAKLAAVAVVGEAPALVVQATLNAYRNVEDPALAEAVADTIADAERRQAMWGQAQNLWFGLSLGSVLLLAAIGLAITFGVMGVINLAHGELVMLGAYTTYVVQQWLRTNAPEYFGWSLAIAVPLAFLFVGAVGVAIERGIVRHLYGRPLETLLATWGVSLILQQAVRTAFGPTNREVGTPDWMSGAFQLGEMTVTWPRVAIVIFSLTVFFGLLLAMRYSAFGLQMRAVTQNRPMAANLGIRTGRVDALTFGLGAGIAGLAGVALSQIDNVSPNLGQGYIIDSFLVVVFGGVGNLWGTLAAAMGLGIANKFLEPWAGAVLGKILILIFIILFIQKRPRGLFPQRGRAAEG
ncbi:urea ABC transporter permease subunit UrtB [Pararhodobacter sp. CCB-MM2]|uniref:urea ABC transporter permease subunit UrtB n=1 Tax=Pararhodobacter sp. CCB-MM2 TaxID=1786003 RepID=UPI00082D6197|nr:urea ABC transporter permease subunit UrtB [Pararhodobacter sp. CCB-MM2]